jgi:CheY-like chemotaxis protein
MKVLIVDDSAADRSILRDTFQAHDCEIIEVENGRKGLSMAAEYRLEPDVLWQEEFITA